MRVAISENFWQATGQSNLADRMEGCLIGQSADLGKKIKLWKLFLKLPVCMKGFDFPVARQNF